MCIENGLFHWKTLFIVISPSLSCDSCENEMLWKSSNTTQKDRKASFVDDFMEMRILLDQQLEKRLEVNN